MEHLLFGGPVVEIGGEGRGGLGRLTCLEEGVRVERDPAASLPEVRSEGVGFLVEWPLAGGIAE